MKTIEVNYDDLQNLIFQVYERGNITTEKACEMLEMKNLGDFVVDFEEWQGED
jgi:hypothetical protein